MTHQLFAPEFHELLEENDPAKMAEFLEELHPATVAEILEGECSVEQVWQCLGATSIAKQAEIFEYFSPEWQEEMVGAVGRPHVARLIEQMSSDDRADLLRRLPASTRESILRLVDEADRRDIAKLVEYPENSAGAVMTTDYAWLPANIPVEEAVERLRLQAPDTETIYYVYVVDDQRRLLGVVSLRDLILASRRTIVGDIMETDVESVRVTDDREQVAEKLRRFDLIAIPVTDADDRLVGIVTHDDAIDVVVEEATEDAHRMGAVSPLEENYLEVAFRTVWQKRATWLSILFVAELVTFWAMEYFEETIAEVVVLSLFVPLCISTGGNSGAQAATLITRALALGQVRPSDWIRVFRHEIAMGLLLGLTLGVIGFARGYWTPPAIRSSTPPRLDAFTVTVEQPLMEVPSDRGKMVELPSHARQIIVAPHPVKVELPHGASLPEPKVEGDQRTYSFPRKCSIPRPPIDAWRLGWVIGISVAFICLWGTLVGALLPLLFRRLGYDPGVASTPFVATAVDVTGIVIYFSIAKIILFDVVR